MEAFMSRIMQNRKEASALFVLTFRLCETVSDEYPEISQGMVELDVALREKMVEVTEVYHDMGESQILVSNHSSWKVLLFKEDEVVGKFQDRLLTISITIQHNASAIIPGCLFASGLGFGRETGSVHRFLKHFKAIDDQAGIIIRRNGKITGERYGLFPLVVDVNYSDCFCYA
jgi:hypothetical protein